jgi:DNA-binding CsgD family transcriptional regulator
MQSVKEHDFVGREAELAIMSTAAEGALAGKARVIWVSGDPGSGKTGLIRAFLDDLPSDFKVMQAEADELASDMAFDLVGQLGEIVSSDPFNAGLQLLDVLAEARGDRPLVLVLEDLHWADSASRLALLTLVRRLGSDKVLVIASSRREALTDDWERFIEDPERCTRVELGPLSAEDIARLADRHGITLSQGAAERLEEHTRGLVLYVRTLLAELPDERLNSGDGDLPAPRSLASTTIGRVAELPTESQQLVGALAVANQRIALNTVGQIAGLSDPTRALEALLATGLVEWSPSELGTPIEFAHPLFRAAVYDDLAPMTRRVLHQHAAQSLDARAALSHRVAAADPADSQLIGDLAAAAQAEEAGHSLGLAARYWLWLASLATTTEGAESALLAAVRLLLADVQVRRALELRSRILDGNPCALRSLLLGKLYWEEGDAANADAWFRDAVTLASGEDSQRDIESSVLAHLAIGRAQQNRGAEAIELARRSLALEPTDQPVKSMAWGALAVGEGCVNGAASGLELLQQCLDGSGGVEPPPDADLIIYRGTLRFYAGQNAAGAGDLRRAIDMARQGAPMQQLPRAHLQLAQLLIVLGDWDSAIVHARTGLSLVESEHQVWIEAQAHSALGIVLASRGEWNLAQNHLHAAERSAASFGTTEATFTVAIATSSLARARDQSNMVIELLTPLTSTISRNMMTSLGWWPPLIEARIALGDLSGSSAEIEQLKQAASDRRIEMEARIAGLRARVEFASGEFDGADAHFRHAITLAGPDDPLLDRALLHHHFGRLLHILKRRPEAIEQLRVAHDLFDGVGAQPFRERVDRDLDACGVRSRQTEYRSPLALTDREQDVAVLVAKGMTNREVAAELYVSTKAVEYHLRNIFGKLGITSRRQILAHVSVLPEFASSGASLRP